MLFLAIVGAAASLTTACAAATDRPLQLLYTARSWLYYVQITYHSK